MSADADEVWNRACDPDAPFTHPGDAALAAVLLCHGTAMNGGLLHAAEGLERDQLERAVAGHRSLALDAAAAAVDEVAGQAAALDEDDPGAGERLEDEANRRYDDDAMSRHHTFLFTVDDDRVIDGAAGGNESRFINHSCAPNCRAVNEDGRIVSVATTPIAPCEAPMYE